MTIPLRMRNGRTLLVVAILMAGQLAMAEPADDVECNKCIDTPDIAKHAIGEKKLKNGAVSIRKLDGDLRRGMDAALQTMQSHQNVSISGAAAIPMSSSDEVEYTSYGGVSSVQGGRTELIAPVNLPHGMTIEFMACRMGDAAPEPQISIVLGRTAMDTFNPEDEIILAFSTPRGFADSRDFIPVGRFANAEVSIVDNQVYTYFMRVVFSSVSADSTRTLALAGCVISLTS